MLTASSGQINFDVKSYPHNALSGDTGADVIGLPYV